ncbi:glycosyltransferase family 2 protein [Mucilaginibacter sp. SP1R1]|uniref:glycosyltransferase family 2 protein n=1 Tax=Mucilaginibacter sp. SP1R1 TaxID=2723091 RepID=UPI00161BBF36|nr:glycosyltransferase family 2 protein [Mucilaginibacter sp. SP1R1]MBB6149071.1 glycosyltransferase involved in cell wall biosynthesis [Mucilaginibacter sp. SP1R1]
MPLLSQLPATDKKGWPWNQEVGSNSYDSKSDWPKISIVTPSYNQGQFIEETIRSILLQNYPNLEYIIIDGGSSDDTVEIIKKYEPWITLWVSEKDKGQANAINKGVKKCTGDVFNWINSDDFLAPSALLNVGKSFVKGATVAGRVFNFYDNDPSFKDVVENKDLAIKSFIALKSTFHQPGVWCDLQNILSIGQFSESSSYYFDRIFFTSYFLQHSEVIYDNNVLVHFRYHVSSKTVVIRDSHADELINFYERLLENPLFNDHKQELTSALYYQLLPEKRIHSWEFRNIQKDFITRLATYMALLLKWPGLLKTRHFYTKLKRSVFAL